MKKVIAYYLLLLYTANLFKAPTIWVADIVAHAWFPAQHKQTMHKEGGSYHVHYQITEANKQDQPPAKSASMRMENEVALCCDLEALPAFCFLSSAKSYIFSQHKIFKVPLQIVVPPPRLIVLS